MNPSKPRTHFDSLGSLKIREAALDPKKSATLTVIETVPPFTLAFQYKNKEITPFLISPLAVLFGYVGITSAV
jgi:hypothetical protein